MPSTWFTSDHHFGHGALIRLCNRPYTGQREMDEDMVARWNARVQPDDTVYYIGDFAYKCSRQYALGILSRLAGRIHLVRGNHDKTWLDDHVLSSRDYVELSDHGTRLVLMHYPLESWKGSRRGARMLHGHRHTRGVQDHWGRLDVGVDGHDFYPWHLDEVVQHFLGV